MRGAKVSHTVVPVLLVMVGVVAGCGESVEPDVRAPGSPSIASSLPSAAGAPPAWLAPDLSVAIEPQGTAGRICVDIATSDQELADLGACLAAPDDGIRLLGVVPAKEGDGTIRAFVLPPGAVAVGASREDDPMELWQSNVVVFVRFESASQAPTPNPDLRLEVRGLGGSGEPASCDLTSLVSSCES